MTLTEKAWLQRVRHTARLYGWHCYHTHDSRRSEPGFPDVTLVRDGRLLFAELKAAKGRVTRDQQAWLSALAGCGPPQVHIWRPADWPEVLAELRRERPL